MMLFTAYCLLMVCLASGTIARSSKHSHHHIDSTHAHHAVNLSHIQVYGWKHPHINKYPGARVGFDPWDNMPQEPSYHFPSLPLQAEVRIVDEAGLSSKVIQNTSWSGLPKALQQAMIARYMEMDGAGRMAIGLADPRILTNDPALRKNANRSAQHLMTRAVDLAVHFVEDFGIDHAVPCAISSWLRHQELASPLLLFNEGRDLSRAIQHLLANQTHGNSSSIHEHKRLKDPRLVDARPIVVAMNSTTKNATLRIENAGPIMKNTGLDGKSIDGRNRNYTVQKRQSSMADSIMSRSRRRRAKNMARMRQEVDGMARQITEMELRQHEQTIAWRKSIPKEEYPRMHRFRIRLADHWCEAVEICRYSRSKVYRFFDKPLKTHVTFKTDGQVPEYELLDTGTARVPPSYEASQQRGWATDRRVNDDFWRNIGTDGAMDDPPPNPGHGHGVGMDGAMDDPPPNPDHGHIGPDGAVGDPPLNPGDVPRPAANLPKVEESFIRRLTTMFEEKSLSWVERHMYIALWEWRRPFRFRWTRKRPKFPENGAWPSSNWGNYKMTPEERDDFIRKWRDDIPTSPEAPVPQPNEPDTPDDPHGGSGTNEDHPADPNEPETPEDPHGRPNEHGGRISDPPPETPGQGLDVPGGSPVEAVDDIGETAETAAQNIGRSLGAELSSEVSKDLGVRVTQRLATWFSRFFVSTEEAMAKLGGRMIATGAGEMILAAGQVTVDGVASLIGLLNPLLIVVDVAMLPTMFVDMIAETAPYDYGTCRKSTNLCYGWDGATANCQRRYPCHKDGAKCAYRKIRPQKVVCNWDEYNAWKEATGISATAAAEKGFDAHIQEKAFVFARDKAAQLQAKYDACLLSSGGKKCEHINKKLKKWRARELRHAIKMDYMRSSKVAKQAREAWTKAEAFSKQYREAHNLMKHREAAHNTCQWRYCNETYKAEVEKLHKEAQVKHDRLRYQLVSTMRTARELTMKADPIGMTNKITKSLATPLNGTSNLNTTTTLNLTTHGNHTRDWGTKPRNITVDLSPVMTSGTWSFGFLAARGYTSTAASLQSTTTSI